MESELGVKALQVQKPRGLCSLLLRDHHLEFSAQLFPLKYCYDHLKHRFDGLDIRRFKSFHVQYVSLGHFKQSQKERFVSSDHKMLVLIGLHEVSRDLS